MKSGEPITGSRNRPSSTLGKGMEIPFRNSLSTALILARRKASSGPVRLPLATNRARDEKKARIEVSR